MRSRSNADRDGAVIGADVDMGAVTFDPAAIGLDAPSAVDLEATFHGVTYRGDAAGMGNPHLVLFVDDPDEARVVQHGPRLERDERFPQRTNVEFVIVEARDRMRMRVWERGVGETLSCGTGSVRGRGGRASARARRCQRHRRRCPGESCASASERRSRSAAR